MVTYVLTLQNQFPKGHICEGNKTLFGYKITLSKKIHTIRSNYNLWAKRFDKIDKGLACLSVREWSGKPYRSKQDELFRFYKSDGIGLEKLHDPDNFLFASVGSEEKAIDWSEIAKNDGLTFENFCDWFKVRQNEPMAIIHFTKFRYNNENPT